MVGKIIHIRINKKVMCEAKTSHPTTNNGKIISYPNPGLINKKIIVIEEYAIKNEQFWTSFINKNLKIKFAYVTKRFNFIIKN
jgi:hypothetical protein